jgi:hypothetical protein
MPFNPNLPVEGTPVDAAEMRAQLNALKALIDAKPSMDDVNAAIVANSSANVNSMEGPEGSPSDPPTQQDVLTLYYFGNNLLSALKRPSP